MRPIRAVLIDIDGVLTVSWKPLPGEVAALQRLRAAAFPLALVTNTTSRTRPSIASALAGREAEVVGKPAAAFFATALAHLHAEAAHTVMVGDDVETDVLAGQPQGLTGDWSRPASTSPAPTAAPAVPPTMSWTPSPTYQPCWSNCHERSGAAPGAGPRVLQAADAPW